MQFSSQSHKGECVTHLLYTSALSVLPMIFPSSRASEIHKPHEIRILYLDEVRCCSMAKPM